MGPTLGAARKRQRQGKRLERCPVLHEAHKQCAKRDAVKDITPTEKGTQAVGLNSQLPHAPFCSLISFSEVNIYMPCSREQIVLID